MRPSELRRQREVWSRHEIRQAFYSFLRASGHLMKIDHVTVKTDKDKDHILSFRSVPDYPGSNNAERSIVIFNEKENLNQDGIWESVGQKMFDFVNDKTKIMTERYIGYISNDQNMTRDDWYIRRRSEKPKG